MISREGSHGRGHNKFNAYEAERSIVFGVCAEISLKNNITKRILKSVRKAKVRMMFVVKKIKRKFYNAVEIKRKTGRENTGELCFFARSSQFTKNMF